MQFWPGRGKAEGQEKDGQTGLERGKKIEVWGLGGMEK